MIKELFKKYQEFCLYVIVGLFTTVLNTLVYWLCMKSGINNVFSTITAWIAAVMSAFWMNKLFVFRSFEFAPKKLLQEMGAFFGCRLGTGVLDVAFMYCTVDKLGWYPVLMKLISDFIVTLLNFIASKFFIFKKKKE